MSRNLDLMLAAASQEEENNNSIAALEKAGTELHTAIDALNSAKKELESTKSELQKAKTELNTTYQKLVDAKKALNAAAGSVDNIVGGITNAIVKAEQSTVPVGVKESDMTEINKKFAAFINKINGIVSKATSDQIQEFENQRKNARKQYEDYDGIWLGHIAQYVFMFFFLIGLGICIYFVVMVTIGK